MMSVIALANQKGGVGKTTSTVNLAAALLKQEKRVLVIDLDPQSSLSISCGLSPQEIRDLEASGRTLYYALVKDKPLEELVIGGQPDIIPSSIRLANAETELVSPFGAVSLLKEQVAKLRKRYDFILIDCPPTLSLLTINGLAAADAVLIPVKTDYLSIMGIPLLMETIRNVQRRANPELQIIGILPTLYNPRNVHDNDALAELKNAIEPDGITVFEPINRSTGFDKAAVEGKSTLERFPETPGVQKYCTIAEVLASYE
jgi:chromosome partitioning protein